MEINSSGSSIPLIVFAVIVALAAVMVAVKFITRSPGGAPVATGAGGDSGTSRRLIVVALALAIAIALAILVLVVQPGGGS